MAERDADDELPAWSVDREAVGARPQPSVWPLGDARAWAWGGSRGEGVRVCIVDSGVDGSHPSVGAIQSAVAVTQGPAGELAVVEDDRGDAFGHGTACAAIIRELAPECEIHSVRVLGGELTGTGPVLLHGLRWALEQRFEVINLSLSTTKSRFAPELRELTDAAYFCGSILVASAHNMPVEAVAGEGADALVGQRIPATTGLAGWSLASEEPIAVADVSHDPRFARDFAEGTGFIPTRMSIHPLLHDERSLGVLSVLDQGAGEQVGLADMNVLALIATHAAAALALVQAARHDETGGDRDRGDDRNRDGLASLKRALADASPAQREAALAIVAGLERLLAES